MIPLQLFRALKSQCPDKATRLALIRAKTGVAGLFIFKPALGRFEVNSVEFCARCAELGIKF
jgi:predicted P-loop ATPase/GTPase